MGVFQNLMNKLKEQDQAREDIDDDQTKDRFLRSLRRQRRTQMEELEKKRLKKDIKAFELERTRRVVLGEKIEDKTKLIKARIVKKKSVLFGRQFMIPKKKVKGGFLSKSKL